MTYDIYHLTEDTDGDIQHYSLADKIGELTPGASDTTCYFGPLKLWHKDTGFISGQIRFGKYLLVSHA